MEIVLVLAPGAAIDPAGEVRLPSGGPTGGAVPIPGDLAAPIERAGLLRKLPPDVAAALSALREGATEDAVVDEMRRLGGHARVPVVLVVLDRLARAGALRFAVRTGGRELAVLAPTSPGFALRPLAPPPDQPLQLSRFAWLHRDGDALVLDSPRARARLILGDADAAAAILALASPATLRELGPAHAAMIALLARAGFVVEVDGDGRTAEDRDPALAGWELHDLVFHVRSRRRDRDAPRGATYRLDGVVDSLPAVAPLRGPALALAPVDLARLAREDPPLASVMEARHSTRDAGSLPITLAQLGELLARCAGVRAVLDGERDQLSRRPYPSGGARYPLEVHVVARACAGLAPGLHRYDPLGHRLETVRAMTADVEALLAAATVGAEPPQVLLVLSARFLRASWKYAAIAYALVLQEAGALTQSFYLAATAMQLGACAVASADSDLFARATGLDPDAEGSVAAIAVGSLPTA